MAVKFAIAVLVMFMPHEPMNIRTPVNSSETVMMAEGCIQGRSRLADVTSKKIGQVIVKLF